MRHADSYGASPPKTDTGDGYDCKGQMLVAHRLEPRTSGRRRVGLAAALDLSAPRAGP